MPQKTELPGDAESALFGRDVRFRNTEYRAHPDWPFGKHLRAEQLVAQLLGDAGKWTEAAQSLREFLANERRRHLEGDPKIASTLAMLGEELLRAHPPKPAEAELVLRECLAIREKKLPDNWLRFNAMSLLGGALAGQGAELVANDLAAAQEKFLEAESLLLEAYQRIHPPMKWATRKRESLERIVNLYESWQAAEPDAGHDAKAAKWRSLYTDN